MFNFLSPLFVSPFELPGFPFREALHRVVVHFPVALLIVSAVFDGLFHLKRTRHRKYFAATGHLLYYIGYVSLLLTFATGLLTSNRKGLSLSDPAWIQQNPQLAASIINHRGLAVTTVIFFTVVTVLRRKLLKGHPWTPGSKRATVTVATALGLGILAVTAHFGGNIAL